MSEQLARSAVAQSALLMLGYWQEQAYCSRLRMKGECLHVILIWVILYPFKVSCLTYLVIAVTDSVSCIPPVRQELLLFEALNIYYLITNCAKLMNLRCLFTILSGNCKSLHDCLLPRDLSKLGLLKLFSSTRVCLTLKGQPSHQVMIVSSHYHDFKMPWDSCCRAKQGLPGGVWRNKFNKGSPVEFMHLKFASI